MYRHLNQLEKNRKSDKIEVHVEVGNKIPNCMIKTSSFFDFLPSFVIENINFVDIRMMFERRVLVLDGKHDWCELNRKFMPTIVRGIGFGLMQNPNLEALSMFFLT